MKPVLFLLNDRKALKSDRTTSTLMLACHRKGHPVFVTDVLSLRATGARELLADAVHLPKKAHIGSTLELVDALKDSPTLNADVLEMEAVFIRTTPGKDIERAWAHRLALEIMRMVSGRGVNVLNDPIGLQRASSKLYTVCLPPEFVPRTMVCHSLESVQDFSAKLGGAFVLKPLLGCQGRDVFFLDDSDSSNMQQIVEVLGRTGYIVAQEYIPEATLGDIRVLTLDDKIITGERQPLGIRRTPAPGERRSNISLGGTASIVELTMRQTEICLKVAKHLARDGIRFAGLDLIGEKIVEVNVFSPSGLQEFDRHLGVDVSGQVAEHLIERKLGDDQNLSFRSAV